MTTTESASKVYPDLNADLLRSVLAAIEADPEHYNPRYWAQRNACGTSFCFAGQTLHQSGYELVWHVSQPTVWQGAGSVARFAIVGVDLGGAPVEDWIGGVAEKLLGLTTDEANDLFDTVNSVEILRGYVDRLLAGDRWSSTETVTER